MVSLGEAVGITKCVDYAAEVEVIGAVAVEAEGVQQANGFVDVPVLGAEVVDFRGPVWLVGDGLLEM